MSGPAHHELKVAGRVIGLDKEGFMLSASDWSPEVAETMAEHEGVELGPDHWWLIDFVRHHYLEYGTPPLMRMVVAALRRHRATAGSRDLYRLFPEGPVREACRYGGLPKPDWCI